MKRAKKSAKKWRLLLLPLLAALAAVAAQWLPARQVEVAWSPETVPEFSGEPYVALASGQPDFSEEDLTTETFEIYSPLDALGRCGVAYANISPETMPTEERGEIGMVKPSGWHTVKYDCVDGKYLYNRCHLIGYQLAGENANECNLITGTRYLNVKGMLPFEDQVANYVKETDNHVLYRVTPIYDGLDLVAKGVQMEAMSVEDRGEGVCFNVYVYNAQPGIAIDYATGESWLTEEALPEAESPQNTLEENSPVPEEDLVSDAIPALPEKGGETTGETTQEAAEGETYILNNRSMRFHLPSCSGAADIKDANRAAYTGDREELIARGYVPCGQCKP